VKSLVYYCKELPEHIPTEQIALLPFERRNRMEKYKRKADRILCVAAYRLYQYGMKNEYGFAPQNYWKTDENGKPYPEQFGNVAFNISHCTEGVACVIGNSCCGIDYQNISEVTIGVSKMVCGEKELQALSKSAHPDRLFCRFWSLKEAYGKYHGFGITYEMKDYDFSETDEAAFERFGHCFSVMETETSCIAVCADCFYDANAFIRVAYDAL
jgi:4'-phosphopantetheinyl transferase